MSKYNYKNPLIQIFISIAFRSTILFSRDVDLRLNTFPAAILKCFYQDSFGFIRIGTQDGLLRYDGITIRQYNHVPFDWTSLSSNNIMAIKEDKDHNLWIETHGNGLNHFNQVTGKFTRFEGNAQQDPVRVQRVTFSNRQLRHRSVNQSEQSCMAVQP
jgi:hypothetical protein